MRHGAQRSHNPAASLQKETPDRNPVRGEMVEAAGQWFRIFQCGLDYAFTKIGVGVATLTPILGGACYSFPHPLPFPGGRGDEGTES